MPLTSTALRLYLSLLTLIASTLPDPNLYPEFDPWLRDSKLAEEVVDSELFLTK